MCTQVIEIVEIKKNIIPANCGWFEGGAMLIPESLVKKNSVSQKLHSWGKVHFAKGCSFLVNTELLCPRMISTKLSGINVIKLWK